MTDDSFKSTPADWTIYAESICNLHKLHYNMSIINEYTVSID